MMVCSFCGKSEDKVRRILYGGLGEKSVICNECVLASYNMLVESGDIKPGRAPSAVSDSKSEFISNGSELMKPEEIKAYLDQYIIGQDEAKKILTEDEIEIYIELNAGNAKATAWGCDLTYDYVKINGDYRS